MRMPKRLGVILLAIWLVSYGLMTAPFLRLNFAYGGELLAILAIATGVVLFIQRA